MEECYNIPTTITIGVPKYKLQILMITYGLKIDKENL